MAVKKLHKLTAVLAAACILITSAFGSLMVGATDPPETPEVSEPTNVILNTKGYKLTAQGGVISADTVSKSSSADSPAEFTDGKTDTKGDIGSDEGNYPGVLFDLGKYYDISKITAITERLYGAHLVSEMRVYASKSMNDLYTEDSLLFQSNVELEELEDSTPHDLGQELDQAVTAQYVAFFFTGLEGSNTARMWEIEIYGTLSEEQPPQNVMLAENNWTGKAPTPKEVKATDDTLTQIQDTAYSYGDGGSAAFTDGDVAKHIDVYGGIPDGSTQIRGWQYDLKSYYDVSKFAVHVYGDRKDIMVKDVYIFASENLEDLYNPENLVAQIKGDEKAEKIFELEESKKVRYVTFFLNAPTSYPRVRELEVYGYPRPDEEQPAPPPPNILTEESGISEPMPYYDPAGQFNSEFSIPQYPDDNGDMQPTFASVLKGISLDGFTDGDTSKAVQIYGGMPDDQTRQGRPVIIYDLGAYYDITGACMYVSSSIQRARIYASGSLEKITYYDNLIYVDEEDNSAAERSVTLETPKKVRYIAFCLAKKAKDGGWIASEFEVYGTASEDQTPPVESDDPKYPEEGTGGGDAPTESDNLLFGLTPDEAGLVKKDDTGNFDYYTLSGIGGTEGWETQLSDGIKQDSEGYYQNVQLWASDNAAAKAGGKYVLIYDLGAYYDLNKVAVQAVPGAESQTLTGWEVYAGNDSYTLFSSENKIGEATVTPAEHFKEVAVTASSVRYIAYVLSQKDTEYGAARVSEVEAYGTKVGDIEPEPETGVSHLELTDSATGITVWIYALEDEVEPDISGTLSVTEVTDEESFENVYRGLDRRYGAEKIYRIEIMDDFDMPVDLGGRNMRVFFPISEELESKKDLNFAVVDGTEADLLSGIMEDGSFVFDTTSYLTLAVVSREGKAIAGGDTIPETSATVSVLTLTLFIISISLVVVTKKKKYPLWFKKV